MGGRIEKTFYWEICPEIASQRKSIDSIGFAKLKNEMIQCMKIETNMKV